MFSSSHARSWSAVAIRQPLGQRLSASSTGAETNATTSGSMLDPIDIFPRLANSSTKPTLSSVIAEHSTVSPWHGWGRSSVLIATSMMQPSRKLTLRYVSGSGSAALNSVKRERTAFRSRSVNPGSIGTSMRVPLNGFFTVLTCVPRLHVHNARVNNVSLVFSRPSQQLGQQIKSATLPAHQTDLLIACGRGARKSYQPVPDPGVHLWPTLPARQAWQSIAYFLRLPRLQPMPLLVSTDQRRSVACLQQKTIGSHAKA